MKRARGSGGRFLNTKQLQEQNQLYQAQSGSVCSEIMGNSIISQSGPTYTPSSDTAGASTASQDRSCLPMVGFCPTTNFSEQGGGSKLVVNSMQQRVSTIRWREVGTTPFPGALPVATHPWLLKLWICNGHVAWDPQNNQTCRHMQVLLCLL